MNYLKVPDSNIKLTDGSVVMLARFPGTKWVVHYGWYDYAGRRGMGWYFCSIPAQTVIPVTNKDLQLIVVVDTKDPDYPNPPSPPAPVPPGPWPEPGPPYPVPPGPEPVPPYPAPPDPDIFHPHGPHAHFSKNDQFLLDASFVSLPSIKYRDALHRVCNIADGKIVKVNNVDGVARYYAWNAADQRWDEKFFENDTEKALEDYYKKEEVDALIAAINVALEDSVSNLEDRDNQLNEKIDSEISDVEASIEETKTALEDRIQAVEEEISTGISEDVTRLEEAIESEVHARETADQEEASIREHADQEEAEAREAAIAAEAEARQAAIVEEAEARQAAISAEAEARQAAIVEEAEARIAGIAQEAEARSEAIQLEIASRNEAIAQEAANRQAAIAEEAEARAAGIAAEATARDEAISSAVEGIQEAYTEAVSQEASARQEAIEAEASARQEAIEAEAEAREEAVHNEELARVAKDSELADSIDAVSDTVAQLSSTIGTYQTSTNTKIENLIAEDQILDGKIQGLQDYIDNELTTLKSRVAALESAVFNISQIVATNSNTVLVSQSGTLKDSGVKIGDDEIGEPSAYANADTLATEKAVAKLVDENTAQWSSF